ncbi:MAG: methionine--tRNA ligase [Acidobacteriota bacterium]
MTKLYVTTPIYYVNDNPHIGHVYTTVIADVVARYGRLRGRDVRFLTGTDEHGQKVERSAAKAGLSPKALADRVVQRYHELWPRLHVTHDQFIRTTDDLHVRGAIKLFRRMQDAGDIYKSKYEGWYCTSCESFWPEGQLVDGKLCPDDRTETEWLSEESYFFKLSAYQDKLLAWYDAHPDFVRPATRLSEVRSFVSMGLKDLSVSRTSFSWGIPVPGDERHVIYVWIDALSNYVTALGYADDGPGVGRYWPADLQLVGKDIVRHHAVYWPAMLMSAGLPLPKTIFAHGWWLRDEQKMSKSKGNVVDPLPLLEAFGADALRYFLLREMVFGLDASYSDEALLGRYNSDLANDLGNLASRVLTLVAKFAPGGLPAPSDGELRPHAERAIAAWTEAFDTHAFRSGLEAVLALSAEANRYIVRQEPWKTRDAQVLSDCAEVLRLAALMLSPVLPTASPRLLESLGQAAPRSGDAALVAWGAGRSGVALPTAPPPLFPRIDAKEFFKDMETPEPPKPAPAAAPAAAPEATSDEISIDDFRRIKLRTGVVRNAERIPKADRILKLTIDLGTETRTVVAGIAATYAPDALIGRTVTIVANLKKAVIRGIESHGMVLAADVEGKAILVGFDREIPPGTTVR